MRETEKIVSYDLTQNLIILLMHKLLPLFFKNELVYYKQLNNNKMASIESD